MGVKWTAYKPQNCDQEKKSLRTLAAIERRAMIRAGTYSSQAERQLLQKYQLTDKI